ncbi:alpha/beta hydrolase [Xanthomonas massiliensis]|uniref:alpha/beta hydrolase n=1 Tax=Xanthomonas massiliensis TaxID=1720302 RepID=UPI0008251DDB|nr:alpha/beta hydrolase [Xanthomonas massiliensis]
MSLLRSCVLALAVAAVASLAPRARADADAGLGIVAMPLYPDQPDGPRLTVFTPAATRGNGTAVIIAPGGGYTALATNHEGRQAADWFAAHGIVAFVLEYRLGAEHPFPVPLHDARQALARVRALATRYRLAGDRIGVAGFSAGGHLMATLATTGTDLRPDFVVLAYPWLNAMQPNDRGLITYCGTVGKLPPARCADYARAYTPVAHVDARTPPTFLYATSDDAVVSVAAITAFYDALVQAAVPVELHLFAHGAHGSGLGGGDPALDAWPMLLAQWLRGRGLLDPAPGSDAALAAAIRPAPAHALGTPYTTGTRLADLLADPRARQVLEAELGAAFLAGLPDYAGAFGLEAIAVYRPDVLDPACLQRIAAALARLAP